MNLHAIQAFVLSHQLGSISAAATKMKKNRAQLSQWISNLEIDWNVELFTRSGHKPVLSEQGLKMLPLCEQLLNANQQLIKQVEHVAEQDCLRLNIGISAYLQNATVAELLSQFNQRHPNIDLHLYQRRDEQLLNWQEKPQLDLILSFYRDAYPNKFNLEHLCDMPLVAVCATNHPLANTSAPTLQQILSHTWITILAANDISLWDPDSIPRKIEVEQHELAIQLCLRGCGVFVGEQKQLAPYLKTGQLKIVDHKDAITTERLGLIYQKHWAASPALNSLINLCKAHFS